MGAIQQRIDKKGHKTFRAQVRMKSSTPVSATFKRKTDAKKWIQSTEASIREGRYFNLEESKKHTLSELIERYKKDCLKHLKSPDHPIHTLGWWNDKIGHLTLDNILTPLLKEHWDNLSNTKSERTKKLLSNRTLNSYLETLSAMFSVAVREYGWMKDNPLSRIKRKPLRNQRTRYLSNEELKDFMKAVSASSNTYLQLAVLISLNTGGRRSEVLSLKWSDIDFERNKAIFKNTKNGETRSVFLGKILLSELDKHLKNRHIESDYIFPNRKPRWKLGNAKNQKPWEELNNPFKRAVKAAQIENFRWHDMRHCAASYLLASGASLGEVGKILGHRTPQMTWRYAHLVESRSDEIVSKMASTFL